MDYRNYLGFHKTWSQNDHSTDIARLDQLLAVFGLKVSSVSDGPRVVTYTADLRISTDIAKILRNAPRFEVALNDPNVRVYAAGAKLFIEKVGNSNEVYLGDCPRFQTLGGHCIALGRDTLGNEVYTTLEKSVHMMIAGQTGSGKSVMLHSIIGSLLVGSATDTDITVIDPKMTEYLDYSRLPNVRVITDISDACKSLEDIAEEMDRRYRTFASVGCRDIDAYIGSGRSMNRKVVIIDELGDLMDVARASTETNICRIAQKARAAGIHLIVATQRPDAKILTGRIKANLPTKVAMRCNTGVNSKIAIDRTGAEKLAGNGDMLFLGNGSAEPIRVQGCFVTDQNRKNIICIAEIALGLRRFK